MSHLPGLISFEARHESFAEFNEVNLSHFAFPFMIVNNRLSMYHEAGMWQLGYRLDVTSRGHEARVQIFQL